MEQALGTLTKNKFHGFAIGNELISPLKNNTIN